MARRSFENLELRTLILETLSSKFSFRPARCHFTHQMRPCTFARWHFTRQMCPFTFERCHFTRQMCLCTFARCHFTRKMGPCTFARCRFTHQMCHCTFARWRFTRQMGPCNSALIALGLEKSTAPVAICPGPNIAYFNRLYTLAEMTDYIYGRRNDLAAKNRPPIFEQEEKLLKLGMRS